MKYHVNDNGKVVQCKATKKPCPKQNFDTPEEAEQHLKIMVKETFAKKNKFDKISKKYNNSYIEKHVLVLDDNIEETLKKLHQIGNPLIVGGAVRDSFVGADNKDIDIEVHDTNIDDLSKFLKNEGYRVDEVGKSFGVLKVSKNDLKDLDISVPRLENRLGAGHRSFEVSMKDNMTVQEAAERRDFTFNAVMYDHENKIIVDPTRGKQDLENKTMRHVSEKFAEDPLRVLRGFQFAGRFELDMAPETVELCKKLKTEYKHLSTERVQEEWGKFFTKSVNAEKAIKVLQQTGWDDTEPGLKESIKNPETKKALQNLPKVKKENRVIYGSAIIMKNMNKQEQKENFGKKSIIGIREQSKAELLSNIDKTDLSTTLKRKMFAETLSKQKMSFKDYGEFAVMCNNKNMVENVRMAVREGVGEKPEELFVNGKEIMDIGKQKPGPWVGKILSKVKEQQYSGKLKNKKETIEFINNML